MKPLKIIIDSTADLMPDFLKENDIDVIPLYVTFDQETFRDGVDINVPQLYEHVENVKKLPKTAAISVNDFVNSFKKYANDYDILFIGISSFFSSVIQNANIAAKEFPNTRIYVHDSMNLSTGIGLQVVRAVKLRKQGKSFDEIITELKRIVPLVRAQFGIETLDYLFKGGRCSSLAYFFGKSFKIKPIIRVEDGKMGVFKKCRGKMINSLNEMLDIFKKDLPNIETDCVMVTHSLGDESEKYLVQELSKYIDPKNIMCTHAGCVVSSHCGRGTIGILYILK